jgi:hypothetical protein
MQGQSNGSDMRQRLFLLALLVTIAAVTTALAPLSIAFILRNRAHARGRSIVSRTKRRLAAAGASIARRFRAAAAS